MKWEITELEALQNAANEIGLKIYEKFPNDKRQTIKKYFAQRGKETVSPVLDYEQLNHFLLGWMKASKRANDSTPAKRLKILFTLVLEVASNDSSDKLLPLLDKLEELSNNMDAGHPQAMEALTYYEDNVLAILSTGMEVKELN